MKKGIHAALQKFGFHLRKYSSNAPDLIQELEPNLLANILSQSINDPVSLLGVSWHPTTDIIRINFQNVPVLEEDITPNKRIILSIISRIFDPLSFFAPVAVHGKLIVQNLWLESKSWDEPVSSSLSKNFKWFVAI